VQCIPLPDRLIFVTKLERKAAIAHLCSQPEFAYERQVLFLQLNIDTYSLRLTNSELYARAGELLIPIEVHTPDLRTPVQRDRDRNYAAALAADYRVSQSTRNWER